MMYLIIGFLLGISLTTNIILYRLYNTSEKRYKDLILFLAEQEKKVKEETMKTAKRLKEFLESSIKKTTTSSLSLIKNDGNQNWN